MKKLAIITTHPIQYNAPLFRLLTERKNIAIKVFYTWSQSAVGKKFDPGFGQHIEWDIPLLGGYEYAFVKNISSSPGSQTYKGINNPSLIKEIQDWGANALLVYGWNFKSHLRTIRFFYKKIPVFFRGDSTLINEKKGLKQILRRIVLRFVYSYVDIALYAGIANKAYFKTMGFDEDQLVFMPHAIDIKRFSNSEKYLKEASLLRHKLRIETGAIVFLFAGKMDDNKNVATLIKAFIALNTEKHYLLIAGNGNKEAQLKEISKDYPSIKFLDFQNQQQMPILYTAADVFVLPSKAETWGLSINEAMAAGKAIIASNTCGAAFDLIKLDKNGFLFQCFDVSALTERLTHFIKHKNASTIMGAASLKIIEPYNYANDCMAVETIMAVKVLGSN